MRLSSVDEDRAIAVIHAAIDAGVTLVDTADVYAPDENSIGHNERLVAKAIAGRGVLVATKGGLVRTAQRWMPDGRASHLEKACAASLERLGRIDLYQLHAPAPGKQFSTSVRALEKMRARGMFARLGLCNVTREQIREARELAEISCVQVELSVVADNALRGGVVEYCKEHGIEVLAHSPLGGPRRVARVLADEVLGDVGKTRGVGAAVVALSWLRSLGVMPLPGATRVETAREAGALIELSDDEKARIAEHFGGARTRVTTEVGGDVVLMMGIPGAGKSTIARKLAGHERLSRDERKGSLNDLIGPLEEALSTGKRQVVLDNTYATRASRQRVIEAAKGQGAPVRCIWVDTPLHEAQINACLRMLERYDRLPDATEIKQLAKKDANTFLPGAQFRFRDELEAPALDEGFAAIERIEFTRTWPGHFTGKAIIVELDGVLRKSRAGTRTPMSEADVELVEPVVKELQRRKAEGFLVLGTAWVPEIDEGKLAEEDAWRIIRSMGILDDVVMCRHRAGPPQCWCRKPIPGMGVVLVRRHQLNPAACVHIGKSAGDRTFAERMGFAYVDVTALG